MGVTGLWKLIEPCGKPVPVETLEGKILAVDISIWLHQVVKGFQDSKGSALQNAHLLGLFHRLCKLLYYRVRPVFVFDGCVPQLKRDTIARRQQQRNKLNNEADRIQALLLQSLAKEQVVQEALGADAVQLLVKSPMKQIGSKSKSDDLDELFKLPELPSGSKNAQNKSISDDEIDSSAYTTDESFSSEESSFEESNARSAYYTNLQAIDVRSQHFRNLPADVRHEILVDIKETRKQSSWGRLHELPSRSGEFSSFQMKRLLKRRAVQESLEEAEQEMGGRSLTFAELTNLFTEEGIIQSTIVDKGATQLHSDENTRFLLVRDLKKKLNKEVKAESLDADVDVDVEMKPEQHDKEAVKLEESKNEVLDNAQSEVKEEKNGEEIAQYGPEYNADLQLAIALSLEENSQVYSEKDYEFESGEMLRLNREQRKNLQNAAVGPARAFMVEFGGLNDEEVNGIMDATQVDSDTEIQQLLQKYPPEAENKETEKEESVVPEIGKGDLALDGETADSGAPPIRISDDSDSTDSDLEEVIYDGTPLVQSEPSKELEIVVDLKAPLPPEEDLFADIFETVPTDAATSTEKCPKRKEEVVVNEKNADVCAESEDEPVVTDSMERKVEVKIPDSGRALSVLNDLKLQAEVVKNMKLSDIKMELDCIELSDGEGGKPVEQEVIEICDSDEGQKVAPVSSTTPTKSKTITQYFSPNYKIQRTSEKSDTDRGSPPPRVVAPFFVRKSPKSQESHASPGKKSAKTLFPADPVEDKEEPAVLPVNAEDVLRDAAAMLKEQKSEQELRELATDLATERRQLEGERNRQDRMGTSISQRMSSECQELLRLFGIPYIVAPMEAEAQCAFLDAMELTNGTITDDSDIWLFGGRTVYKNFFAQNKHVLEFQSEQIERCFNCDRKKLIQLACLVGSDYTTGVHGIGAVTAMEILAAFTSNADKTTDGSDSNMRHLVGNILTTLTRFRDWWIAGNMSAVCSGSSARFALRKKLKNIELSDGFPSQAVVEAYLAPKVDENKETFMWGQPDVESIHEFTKKTFGWTRVKTEDILKPVLKKLQQKKSQATLKNYFKVKSALSVRELKVSKRVQKAIERMVGDVEEETPEKPKKKAPRKKRANGKEKAELNGNEVGVESQSAGADIVTSEYFAQSAKSKEISALGEGNAEDEKSADTATTSKHFIRPHRKRKSQDAQSKSKGLIGIMPVQPVDDMPIMSKIPKIGGQKKPNIPNTNIPIPQRENTLKQLQKNRERAIEIMKQSAQAKQKKKSS